MTLPREIPDQACQDRDPVSIPRRSSSGTDRRLFAGARDWTKKLLYFFYERRLERELLRGAIPKHVGIILDGNRRFGRRRRITDPHELYTLGADKLDHVLDWCATLGIPAVKDISYDRILCGLGRKYLFCPGQLKLP